MVYYIFIHIYIYVYLCIYIYVYVYLVCIYIYIPYRLQNPMMTQAHGHLHGTVDICGHSEPPRE